MADLLDVAVIGAGHDGLVLVTGSPKHGAHARPLADPSAP